MIDLVTHGSVIRGVALILCRSSGRSVADSGHMRELSFSFRKPSCMSSGSLEESPTCTGLQRMYPLWFHHVGPALPIGARLKTR